MGPDLEINYFYLFLTFFLVLLNGFFVAAEFAMVRVRGSQLELKAKTGGPIAKLARGIIHNLDNYLAATQLGVTIASLGLGWVGQDVMTKSMLHLFLFFGVAIKSPVIITVSRAVAFIFITVLHIVFGELAPKTIAIQRSVRTVMTISLPLRVFFIVFRPLIWMLNRFANFILKLLGINALQGETSHSSEELQYLLDQGKETGALDSTEHELIQNVFDFNERVVKNIMVPRTKISGIEITTAQDSLIQLLITEGN